MRFVNLFVESLFGEGGPADNEAFEDVFGTLVDLGVEG